MSMWACTSTWLHGAHTGSVGMRYRSEVRNNSIAVGLALNRLHGAVGLHLNMAPWLVLAV